MHVSLRQRLSRPVTLLLFLLISSVNLNVNPTCTPAIFVHPFTLVLGNWEVMYGLMSRASYHRDSSRTGAILGDISCFFQSQLDSHSPFCFSIVAQARGNSFVYKRLLFLLSFLPIYTTRHHVYHTQQDKLITLTLAASSEEASYSNKSLSPFCDKPLR